MNPQLMYEMIFKRKSFHLFNNIINKISEDELNDIINAYYSFTPLDNNIKTMIKIERGENTTCKRGEEYSILLYSEIKTDYLRNIGYLGEQLDLYLASKNIGALWFGIGKIKDEIIDSMHFVIMIAISKVEQSNFRKDMFKSKRKNIEEIWEGDTLDNVTNIIRFAPSACNTQPWFVRNVNNTLEVYRYNSGKRGIMPANKVIYYNQIDIGIFLYFLDLCLFSEKITFEKELFTDDFSILEKTLIAKYKIKS